jgi:hypothetical protein
MIIKIISLTLLLFLLDDIDKPPSNEEIRAEIMKAEIPITIIKPPELGQGEGIAGILKKEILSIAVNKISYNQETESEKY